MTQLVRNLKTAHKFAFSFGSLLLGIVILSILSLGHAATMQKGIQEIVSDINPINSATQDLMTAMMQKESGIRAFMIKNDPKMLGAYEKGSAQEANALQTLSQHYEGHPELKTMIELEMKPLIAANEAFNTDQIADIQKGKFELARSKVADGKKTMIPFREEMAKVQDYNNRLLLGAQFDSSTAYSQMLKSIIVFTLITCLLGGFFAWSLTRYMTSAIAQLSDRLNTVNSVCITNLGNAVAALEQGDLTTQIETGTQPLPSVSRDEFGAIAKTFNSMLETIQSTIGSFRQSQASLSELVGDLKLSSAQVASASGTLASVSAQVGVATEEITATMSEVSSASEQSARGASEIAQGSGTQAIALSESTEQVKQLADAVGSVARDAAGAGVVAEKTDAAATLGSKAVAETVAGMQRIKKTVTETAGVIQELGEASAKIGVIVTTIDEIAGQTNLLALNAAIEAARAGEAGRGFAVVADEVRKLAERSSSATKEIAEVIGQVQSRTAQAVSAIEIGTKDVAVGTALAEQAGSALQDIQRLVADLSRQVQGIGSAAEEMAASADDVARSITEVAAVVEEASAAAEEMSASAQEVSASIQTVSGTTAQQSASVEELVASAEDLSGVARTLDETIARFKVDASPAASSLGKPRLTLLKAA